MQYVCALLYSCANLLSVLDGAAGEVNVILQDALPCPLRHQLLPCGRDSLHVQVLIHKSGETARIDKHAAETAVVGPTCNDDKISSEIVGQ